MRPYITVRDVDNYELLAETLYEACAETEHYKQIFTIQKEQDIRLHSAIVELMKVNVSFGEQMMKYANDDENFSTLFKILVRNIHSDSSIVIPTRKCDFKVGDDNNGLTYFYISERIEIYKMGTKYRINALHVDEKSDELLYYDDGDWKSYLGTDEYHEAYKSWLAEEQLLKD